MSLYFVKKGRKSGLLSKKELIGVAWLKNKIADLFEINCRYNTMFICAYSDGYPVERIDGLISTIRLSAPSYWKFRKRTEAQISGYELYRTNVEKLPQPKIETTLLATIEG